MTTEILKSSQIDQVMELFGECFFDDHFYAGIFPEETTRLTKMKKMFSPVILYCIHTGYCIGVWDQKELIAFLITFPYREIYRSDPRAFRMIFSGDLTSSTLPYQDSLHAKILSLPGETLFCLSVAVKASYRGMGLASGLLTKRFSPTPNIISPETYPTTARFLSIKSGISLLIKLTTDTTLSFILPNLPPTPFLWKEKSE